MKNILSKAYSLGQEIITWADSGFSISEMKEKRYEICLACPKLVDGFCGSCGCYMKAKVALATSSCPDGKWDALLPQSPAKQCSSCGQPHNVQ
jgi:hypothetical protein